MEEDINIRSEEVEEILGTPPKWLIRYGTIVAILFFIVLIFLAAIVPYPESQTGDITITFTDPPSVVVAPQSGNVEELFVRNNQQVKKDQTLLVFKGRGNADHLLHLQALLDEVPDDNDSIVLNFTPPADLDLGDVQEYFINFISNQNNLKRQNSGNFQRKSTSTLSREVQLLKASNRKLNQQKNEVNKEIDDRIKARNDKEREVANREASQEEVNQITRELKTLRNDKQDLEVKIMENDVKIKVLGTRIENAKNGDVQEKMAAQDELRASFIQLKSKVNQWVGNNMLFAPIDGLVEIDDDIEELAFVNKNDVIVRIIPFENRRLLGKMSLDFENSGLVKQHQNVIIRLKKYPFEEYGALRGRVSWKSRVPDEENKIQIEVSFPNKLITSTGKEISSDETLLGKGQIVTEEKVLLDRIFNYGRGVVNGL